MRDRRLGPRPIERSALVAFGGQQAKIAEDRLDEAAGDAAVGRCIGGADVGGEEIALFAALEAADEPAEGAFALPAAGAGLSGEDPAIAAAEDENAFDDGGGALAEGQGAVVEPGEEGDLLVGGDGEGAFEPESVDAAGGVAIAVAAAVEPGLHAIGADFAGEPLVVPERRILDGAGEGVVAVPARVAVLRAIPLVLVVFVGENAGFEADEGVGNLEGAAR